MLVGVIERVGEGGVGVVVTGMGWLGPKKMGPLLDTPMRGPLPDTSVVTVDFRIMNANRMASTVSPTISTTLGYVGRDVVGVAESSFVSCEGVTTTGKRTV